MKTGAKKKDLQIKELQSKNAYHFPSGNLRRIILPRFLKTLKNFSGEKGSEEKQCMDENKGFIAIELNGHLSSASSPSSKIFPARLPPLRAPSSSPTRHFFPARRNKGRREMEARFDFSFLPGESGGNGIDRII